MVARRTALLSAVVVAAATALPADAAPKEQRETYQVTAPVPFPVSTTVPTYDGCWQGQEGLTRNTKPLTFPTTGSLTAEVAYEGDWDLYLFDAKGAKAAAAETWEVANGGVVAGKEKIAFKKIKPGAKYTLVVCNWLGQADATVTYVFTPKP